MGKFRGGIIVDITPTKVPRLIGKKGSMINMIKDKTNCKIIVGQNGLVWVKGEEDMEQLTKDIKTESETIWSFVVYTHPIRKPYSPLYRFLSFALFFNCITDFYLAVFL